MTQKQTALLESWATSRKRPATQVGHTSSCLEGLDQILWSQDPVGPLCPEVDDDSLCGSETNEPPHKKPCLKPLFGIIDPLRKSLDPLHGSSFPSGYLTTHKVVLEDLHSELRLVRETGLKRLELLSAGDDNPLEKNSDEEDKTTLKGVLEAWYENYKKTDSSIPLRVPDILLCDDLDPQSEPINSLSEIMSGPTLLPKDEDRTYHQNAIEKHGSLVIYIEKERKGFVLGKCKRQAIENVERKNGRIITPLDMFLTTKAIDKIQILCSGHGDVFSVRISDLSKGGRNCAKCSGMERHTIEDVHAFAKTIMAICETDVYKDNRTPMPFLCTICDKRWLPTFSNLTRKTNPARCPNCNPWFHEALMRAILNEGVVSFKLEFTKQKPAFLENMEYDAFCIFEHEGKIYKIAYEYDGIQHFFHIPYFHKTVEEFEGQRARDVKKNQISIKQEVQLTRIRYDEVTPETMREFVRTSLDKIIFEIFGRHLDEPIQTNDELLSACSTKDQKRASDLRIEKAQKKCLETGSTLQPIPTLILTTKSKLSVVCCGCKQLFFPQYSNFTKGTGLCCDCASSKMSDEEIIELCNELGYFFNGRVDGNCNYINVRCKTCGKKKKIALPRFKKHMTKCKH